MREASVDMTRRQLVKAVNQKQQPSWTVESLRTSLQQFATNLPLCFTLQPTMRQIDDEWYLYWAEDPALQYMVFPFFIILSLFPLCESFLLFLFFRFMIQCIF